MDAEYLCDLGGRLVRLVTLEVNRKRIQRLMRILGIGAMLRAMSA